MRNFKILKPIMLNFLTMRTSHDIMFGPEDEGHLEFDGKSIFFVTSVGRSESNNTPGVLTDYLQKGYIEEI